MSSVTMPNTIQLSGVSTAVAGGSTATTTTSSATAELVAAALRTAAIATSREQPSKESNASVDATKYEIVSQNFNITELNRELASLKKMGREAKKVAEVEKHKKPQIKRSIGFVIDVNYGLEDIESNANKIVDALQNKDTVDIDWISDLLNNISELKSTVKNELLIHKIASSSIGGYRTVKYFEAPEVFKDMDLDESEKEKLATKLRSAEYKAKQDYNKFRSSKGKPTAAVMKTNDFRSNSKSIDLLQQLCFKCKKPGHQRRDCPLNKPYSN
jgi:hypothetical protein